MKTSVGIHLRMPPAQVRTIQRAARLEGKKVSVFVREAAIREAEYRIANELGGPKE